MTKKTIVLAAFILTKFLLQYSLVSGEYELHRDEFLHLDQAHHLAWGYISVPPVTSWISSIILLLGSSLCWVRFFPALFGALTIVVVWKSIAALGGNLTALILGATCVLFSVLLRLNLLYHPNSLDVLCWTTFYYMLIIYITTEKPKWFYVGMAVFAIGCLNKYNIIFLVAGLLPALLLTWRNVFTNRHFYFSIVFGLLLISPNLVWQYNNHFPVYHHMQQLAKTQLVNVNRWDFLKDQLLFFIGAFPVIISALYAMLFYPPFKKFRFFFYTMCFTLLVFIYLKAKSYYAIGLYPVYIAFGAVYLEQLLNKGRKKYLLALALTLPVLAFIPLYQLVFPNKSPEYIANNSAAIKKLGLLRWEDGRDHAIPQDFADMIGWKELAHKVDTEFSKLPNQDQTIVICDNYGQAGAINYYTKNSNIKAVSFNADYINWFILDKQYTHLVRVKTLGNEDNELKETSPFFETAYVAGSISNPLAREFGTRIFVFINAKIDINKRIKEEIEQVKTYH